MNRSNNTDSQVAQMMDKPLGTASNEAYWKSKLQDGWMTSVGVRKGKNTWMFFRQSREEPLHQRHLESMVPGQLGFDNGTQLFDVTRQTHQCLREECSTSMEASFSDKHGIFTTWTLEINLVGETAKSKSVIIYRHHRKQHKTTLSTESRACSCQLAWNNGLCLQDWFYIVFISYSSYILSSLEL